MQSDKITKVKKKSECKYKTVNTITLILLIIIHAVFVLIIIRKFVKGNGPEHKDYIDLFSAVVFTFGGLMFGIIGILTNLSLKKHFETFF